MADDIENKGENEAAGKTFTQAELEDILKKRLKNTKIENEQLIDQLKEVQAQMAQQQQAQPPPQPQAQTQQVAQQGNQAPPLGGDPTQAPPLSPSGQASPDIMNAIRQSQQEIMQQGQVEQANRHYQTTVGKMMQEDPKFKSLVLHDKSLKIPHEVGVYLTNQLNPDQAKKTFTELMTNEGAHLKMENAQLKSQMSGSNDLGEWLQKMVNGAQTTDLDSPNVPPDLSQDAKTGTASDDMANVDNYIKTLG